MARGRARATGEETARGRASGATGEENDEGEARRARATTRRAMAARRARALGQANGASLDLGHGGSENLKKILRAGSSYQ
jgi:hypothetical protein